MTFTAEYLPTSKHRYFTFFATAGAAGVTMGEDFAPGFAFRLDKVRLHLSTAHVSIVDFMVWISHHIGSQYNQNLISQAMNGVRDVMYHPDRPITYHDTDTLRFSLILSAANIYGLEVSGWAITE